MIGGVSVELRFGIALVVGLVIGAEREQRMAEGAHKSAGIRTFGIAALLGAVGAQLGAPALVLLGAAVGVGAQLWWMPWWGELTIFGLGVMAIWGWWIGSMLRLYAIAAARPKRARVAAEVAVR